MKYPGRCENVIDVTKAPYFADNTGKTDCTEILRCALDDCLRDVITSMEDLRARLLALAEKHDGNVYIGAEAGRVRDGQVLITGPDKQPPSKILYFPNGTYLVSDTVCYTFDNLCSQQRPGYVYELCRNIHFLGESRENTVIRLRDGSKGYEKGAEKPVISFNRKSKKDVETTNCAQMNTIEDVTVDCGNGNGGAVGILYASSNCGRIANVCVKGGSGFCGIDFDQSSEGCVCSVTVSGFDYGVRTGATSPLVFDGLDLSGNRLGGILTKNGNLNCKNVDTGDLPLFCFIKGDFGRYYCEAERPVYTGAADGAFIYGADGVTAAPHAAIPENRVGEDFSDWVCVDDFGASGDGKTDSTEAIRNAMRSGKSVVLFGGGTYFVSDTVEIPASVRTVDFMYSGITPGKELVNGRTKGVFDICEDGEEPFFAEHFMAGEECSGFFRLFRHSSKRTVVLKDVCAPASLYFNTVAGGSVFFDNCFTLTNHYAQDAALHRDGFTPVFCQTVPVELHGQTAYGRNLNIERAEVELLNDGSELVIDGYKVEGPGVIVKSVNGGKTRINLFNAAWWHNKIEDNAMFELHDSSAELVGGQVFCYPKEDRFCLAFLEEKNGAVSRTYLKECSLMLPGTDHLGRGNGRLMDKIKV